MFSRSVEAWRSLWVERAASSGIPVDFALAWISHESGGNVCSVGIPGVEAGLFQTYHPDDDRYGLTYAGHRAACAGTTLFRKLTAGERAQAVDVGIAYLSDRRARARRAVEQNGLPWPEGSSDFWKLVKLHHALPAFYGLLPAYSKAKGSAAPSWSAWRAWVESLSAGKVAELVPSMGRWSSLEQRRRLMNNAENVGKYGGAERLLGSPLLIVLLLGLAGLGLMTQGA